MDDLKNLDHPVLSFVAALEEAIKQRASLFAFLSDRLDEEMSKVIERGRLRLYPYNKKIEWLVRGHAGGSQFVPSSTGTSVIPREVILSVREFLIVETLSRFPDRIVSFDALLNAFWAANTSDDENKLVHSAVRSIRRKFQKIDPSFNLLSSRSGEGFFWRSE